MDVKHQVRRLDQARGRSNDRRRTELVLSGEIPLAAAMREQLEAQVRALAVRVLVIDETQHVLQGNRKSSPADSAVLLHVSL